MIKSSDNAVVAIEKSIFDVVQSGVEKNPRIIPSSALDSNSLVKCADLLKSFRDNGDIVFAQKAQHIGHHWTRHVFDPGDSQAPRAASSAEYRRSTAVEGNEEKTAGAAKVDIGRAHKEALNDFVVELLKILDINLLRVMR